MLSNDEGAAVTAEPDSSDGAGVVVSDGDLSVVAHEELPHDDSERDIDLKRWAQLAAQALRTEGVVAGELNLLFVDAHAMAQLNEEHMEGTGATDVLAFPIDGEALAEADTDNEVPVLLGDVIVCPTVARRYAAERDVAVDDELALLIVHGVLHILGHDHAEPDETERMRAREQALLDAHHREHRP